MRIDDMSGGLGALTADMHARRRTDGLTQDDLTALQEETEKSNAPDCERFTQLSASFESIDADQDGQLSNEEIKAFAENEGWGPPPGMPPGGRPGPGPIDDEEESLLSSVTDTSTDSEEVEDEEETLSVVERLLNHLTETNDTTGISILKSLYQDESNSTTESSSLYDMMLKNAISKYSETYGTDPTTLLEIT